MKFFLPLLPCYADPFQTHISFSKQHIGLYLVSVRFRWCEIFEFYAATAILGVITAINEHIIETTPSPTLKGPIEPSPFPYALCISAVKDLETLIEVAAEHFYGETKKWNFVAATEGIK